MNRKQFHFAVKYSGINPNRYKHKSNYFKHLEEWFKEVKTQLKTFQDVGETK